jgi:hypothetical protein
MGYWVPSKAQSPAGAWHQTCKAPPEGNSLPGCPCSWCRRILAGWGALAMRNDVVWCLVHRARMATNDPLLVVAWGAV